MKKQLFLCLLSLLPWTLQATQTENNVLHIVPAPGPMNIDGKTADWDLSGGIFACDNVERYRDQYAVQFYAMYDKENVYLLTKWKDPTPLNNEQSSKGGHGFAGDCLQVRFITDYQKPEERVSHWMGWRDLDKISVLSCQYNRDFKGDHLDDAIGQGAKQAFSIDADGKGYSQEIAIPWKLLTSNGQPLSAGANVKMAIEPNFTAGPLGRINIHDIFLSGVVPDRVFTFRAYAQWGLGVLEKSGHMKTPTVRLDDAREFPVKVVDGALTVDWTGLIQKKELPGFKTVAFKAPVEGDVSLIIKNAKGEVVRQLLTENHFEKGKQEIKWDGLTTPSYKTPGEPVEAGAYTWEAIQHPPFTLTWRGCANSGSTEPWENGSTTNWGGDHGIPEGVATDGEKVFLSWSGAEAGKGILACDLEGKVKWRNGSGLGDSSFHLAVDNGILYSIGREDSYLSRQIIRLRTSDGVFSTWEGRTSAALNIPEILADLPEKASQPQEADGMDVKNGKLYLSFSKQQIYPEHIVDWKGLVTKLQSEEPLSQRVYSKIDKRTLGKLKDYLEGKKTEQETFRTYAGGPSFDREALKQLNALLEATDLVSGAEQMAPVERAEANRKYLESYFAGCIASVKTNFLAICDAKTGKLIKTIPAPYPQAIHALDDQRIAFISAGKSVMIADTATSELKSVVSGLNEAKNFAVDASGKFYVGVAGTDQQVKVFTADGQPAGTIGKQGGRALLGKWQAEGIYAPSGMAIDGKSGRLWIAEADFHPKRISVWNLADGKLVKDFFGSAHYGASGSAINPLDPNIMICVGCEWKLDPATGRSVPTGVIDRNNVHNGIPAHTYAVFSLGSNKHLYLATITAFGVDHGVGGLRVYERLGEGDYKLRAEWRPNLGTQTTAVWSDINGDGKQDANEVTTLPFSIQLYGSNQWSGNINPADLTLYGGVSSMETVKNQAAGNLQIPAAKVPMTQTVFEKVFRINPAGFTACGAPKWDLEKMQELPYVWNKDLQAGGFGMLPSKDNQLLVTVEREYFRCYDLTQGKLIWSYPNVFFGVHGSHLAPPPVPGITRGAYGLVGTFKLPETGTVWAVNGNCGEWYLLSEKGYYLGHLFQGDIMQMKFPEKGVPGADMTQAPPGLGGEDFGGTLVQGADGKIYVQAGKVAAWNLLASGFDKIKVIDNGKVTIKPEEITLARAQHDAQMQAAVGAKTLNFKKLTPIFSGNLAKDFPKITPVMFQKSDETVVRTATAWDDQALYLAWDVADNTPWTNGATEPPQMYVSGDTVDFQFGSDIKANAKRAEAVAGDFRISIGSYQGKPTAVLYRNVSDVKKPKSFSSGVIAHYVMQYVDVLPEAKIQFAPRPDKKGYVVEASIPWSALGFTPVENIKYRGDLGVTYGNEAGTRTRLRNYWSNQETGLVDDVVFELKMTPKNWGDFVFEK